MKIRTSDRCPMCDSLLYMVLHPDDVGIAQCVYLDKHGILNVAPIREDEMEPEYHCILCGFHL